MKTAGEYRTEAERLRELAKAMTTQPALLQAMQDLIDELEARARALDNGSS
jgi:hypothetical protein